MSLFLALIGPSGAGKSTVAEILENEYGFFFARDVTTRPIRGSSDTSHTFVDDETFTKMEEAGKFIGTFDAFGARYGLPKVTTNKPVVVLVRAPVVPQMKALIPTSIVVQLEAPINVLELRLSNRDDNERFQPELLEREVVAGRAMSSAVFDSSKLSAEQIATKIVQKLTPRSNRDDRDR